MTRDYSQQRFETRCVHVGVDKDDTFNSCITPIYPTSTFRFEALGMRPTLYSVLLIIHENPGLKQQEVGQTLSIQQPNLVALVNELVSEGLVLRTVNAVDRRSYSLSLTPAGRSRLTQASRAHAENERRLVDAVAPIPADAPDDLYEEFDAPTTIHAIADVLKSLAGSIMVSAWRNAEYAKAVASFVALTVTLTVSLVRSSLGR